MATALLANNADFYLRGRFKGLIPGGISEAVYAEYLRCFQNPATLHAMCEDYRAAASIDLEHDQADMNVKVACPLLALWGAHGAMEPLYDVLATWRERAEQASGRALVGGHWLPEQMPDALATELLAFLR